MKLNKKFMSVMLALCVTAVSAAPVMAADGDAATAPKGETPETGGFASSGSATMTSNDGVTFATNGDDDNLAEATDANGADINVWAKVIDSGTTVYKIDLAWGSMKFMYSNGGGTWNPETHTYNAAGASAGWVVDTYLDGTNNKLDVTNHSNKAVDANLGFALNGTAFNDVATSDNAVIGNFFKTNDNAKTGAEMLTGTYAAGEKQAVANSIDKLTLATADAYLTNAAGARTDSAFFAFSGKPDEGKGAVLDTFKKVGVITVTVTPNDEPSINK